MYVRSTHIVYIQINRWSTVRTQQVEPFYQTPHDWSWSCQRSVRLETTKRPNDFCVVLSWIQTF